MGKPAMINGVIFNSVKSSTDIEVPKMRMQFRINQFRNQKKISPKTRIFNEIIEKDPSCAMAYWGAAMSVWHPLWAPPSEAHLGQGAAILAATDGLAATPRELAYIDALNAFFSSTDTSTHRERASAYS